MSEARAAEYRKEAENCRNEAAKSVRDDDWDAWLRIAQDWESLAKAMDGFRRRERPSE
jgi:hypothetical protein